MYAFTSLCVLVFLCGCVCGCVWCVCACVFVNVYTRGCDCRSNGRCSPTNLPWGTGAGGEFLISERVLSQHTIPVRCAQHRHPYKRERERERERDPSSSSPRPPGPPWFLQSTLFSINSKITHTKSWKRPQSDLRCRSCLPSLLLYDVPCVYSTFSRELETRVKNQRPHVCVVSHISVWANTHRMHRSLSLSENQRPISYEVLKATLIQGVSKADQKQSSSPRPANLIRSSSVQSSTYTPRMRESHSFAWSPHNVWWNPLEFPGGTNCSVPIPPHLNIKTCSEYVLSRSTIW